MVFWRELASGVVLCALCCGAMLYSFMPSKLQAIGVEDSFASSQDISQPQEPEMALSGGALSEADTELEASEGGGVKTAETDAGPAELPLLPGGAPVTPVSARDEVRWLRLPPEMMERPFVVVEPMPLTGSLASPNLPARESLTVVASDGDSDASVEGDGFEEDNGSTPPLQPEFLANRPSIAAPGPSDLLVDDAVEQSPLGPILSEPIQPEPAAKGPQLLEQASPAERVVWHQPAGLLERIEVLSKSPRTQAWAGTVTGHINELGRAVQEQSPEVARCLDALDVAVAEAETLANQGLDPVLEAQLQRTAHALRRRLDVWRHADWLTDPAYRRALNVNGEWDQLVLCLDQIDEFMGDSAVGQAWREYLLFDSLREWTSRRETEDAYVGRELALASLERLTQIPMDPRQRHFITNEPVDRLKDRLQRLAAAPVDLGRLLSNLERYEQTRTVEDARLITRDYRRLALAESEKERALAARLTMHYRNANLRFAVSESLLNRLMPEQQPEIAPVNDIVLGIRAHGQRATSTDMQLSLIPDAHRARLALDVQGRIYSQTTSSSGPATFLTNSLGWYIARKPLELGLDGIQLSPAEVRVSNDLRLRGVRTQFDGLPLLGSLVNSVARSQHAQHQPAANAEIRAKIYHQAKSRIDQETEERLSEVTERLHVKLLEPMRRLRLDPVLIDAETTEERLNMRIRLAGEEQLGSHTPRPRAPSDSLASVQLHESAINNALERLDLDGRTFTLPELSQHVAGRLNNEGWLQLDPDHEEVSITFASANAVGVRCEDGRICLTLRIDRLRHERRVWRDFEVQAFYGPKTQGLSAELVRDGVIQLSGDRLPLGSQIALRGIFVRIFARRRPWDLVPAPIAENPKLAGLEVTQFAIDDGWIGLALGPRTTAARTRRILR